MEMTRKQEIATDIFLGVSGAITGWLFVSLIFQPAGNMLTLLFVMFATFCSISLVFIGNLLF